MNLNYVNKDILAVKMTGEELDSLVVMAKEAVSIADEGKDKKYVQDFSRNLKREFKDAGEVYIVEMAHYEAAAVSNNVMRVNQGFTDTDFDTAIDFHECVIEASDKVGA